MELKIYDKQGIVKMTVSPDNSSQWNHEVGVENVVTVNFTTWEFLVLEVGWYILVEGHRFSIKSEYRPKHIHNSKYIYNLKFYGREHDTQDILFCRLNQGEDDLESVFAYDGTPMDFLNKVVANMNRNSDGVVWKAGEAISANRQTINFNGLYCWDALGEIARAFGTEWWMDGEYLNISKCERGESVSLGYGQGLKSGLTQNENTNAVKWFTRLIPVGSSKNIDKNKYGYATLQLPGREKYIDINTQYGLKEYREEAAFSEIYPHRVGTISSVRSEERTNEETGNYTVYYVKDSSLPFNPDEYMIGGEVIHMTFNSGALAGKDFEVNWSNETKEFEIINQYPDENTQLPGGNLVPSADDTYVLWNISMPDEYIRAAEQELKTAVDVYLAEYSKDISVYSGSTDYIYISKNDVPLLLGQRVRLLSEIYFGNIGRDSRITRVSRKLNNLNEATIECGNVVSSSWKSNVSSSINNIAVSQQNTAKKQESQQKEIDKLNVLSELWEVRKDSQGHVFLYTKYDIATLKGITMYAEGGSLDLPSIYDGLPIDWQTIYWEEVKDADGNVTGRVLKAAGGSGEGGTVNGITMEQLSAYLSTNKYATQPWVEGKGYLTSITSAMVTGALGFTPFDAASFTMANIKSKLGIADWALASSKPSYTFAEILSKPTTVGGYGITDAYKYVQVVGTNPTTQTWYFPVWTSGALGGTNYDLRANNGFRYLCMEGSTTEDGYSILVLGNNVASGTEGNKYGMLRIFNTSSGSITIRPGGGDTTNRNLYLPHDVNGQFVVHSNDEQIGTLHRPVYISKQGVATACTIEAGTSGTRPIVVATDDHQLYKVSTILANYATGTIASKTTGGTGLSHRVENDNGSVGIHVQYNQGLYDFSNSKWLVGSDRTNTWFEVGNVGIGTTTPKHKFHLVGNGWVDGYLYSQRFVVPSGSTYSRFSIFGADNTESMWIQAGGYDGSSPYGILNISGVNANALAELKMHSTKTTISGTLDVGGMTSVPSLKVNGGSLTYDKTNKYWKLEGDLLVTGGVTMFGSDSTFTPSTIMDALVLDSTTLGINDNGQLYVKGGTGGSLDTDSLASYLLANTYVNKVSVSGSGNAVTAASISGHILTLTKGTFALASDLSSYAKKSTTLSGYGITNAYTKTEADGKYLAKSNGEYYGIDFNSTLEDGKVRIMLRNGGNTRAGIGYATSGTYLTNYVTGKELWIADKLSFNGEGVFESLYVGGKTVAKGGLEVTGAAYFGGGTTYYFGSTGNVKCGKLDTTGAATIASTFTASANAFFGGELKGISPEGATYTPWRIIQNEAALYIQAATKDGTDNRGKIYLTGMNAVKLSMLKLSSEETEVLGKLSVDDVFTSKVADGTAPMVITSTTKVANLNADMVDGFSVTTNGMLYQSIKTASDTTGETWYLKVKFNKGWNSGLQHIEVSADYNNTNGKVLLELDSYNHDFGFRAKVSSYNNCNCTGFCHSNDASEGIGYLYLRFVGYSSAYAQIKSTLVIDSVTKIDATEADSISWKELSPKVIRSNYKYIFDWDMALGGNFKSVYDNKEYITFQNHNNGNISLSAATGDLYLGYVNTKSVVSQTSLIPASNNALSLGSSAKQWNILYTKSLNLNGGVITYDSTNKVFEIQGDVVVKGGVSMYSSLSGFTPSTIMDGVVVDGTTIKKDANGRLSVVSGIGGVNESDLASYLLGNNYVNSIKSTGSGNAITGVSHSGGELTFTRGTTFLTSHQSIYNLTLQAGAFTAKTFDPNGAAQTVNIPTTTAHISESGNLYFTSARALAAITGAASSIKDANLTASRALISNSDGKVAVSAVTSTELGYLDGVTSAIQTQINGKAAKATTLSGYGITDGVTTNTAQTITGSKTFEVTQKIKSGFGINDENGVGFLAIRPTTWTGLPNNGTAVGVGTTNTTLYLRSNKEAYLYRGDKAAAYKIIDASGGTMSGTLYFGANTTYYLGSTGNISCNALTADGAATLKSTLSVTGTSSFTGAASYNGGLNILNGSTLLVSSGKVVYANQQVLYGTNTEGTYETCLYPRWADATYLNYGSKGFNIRNNSSVLTMHMTNDNKVGIGINSPAYTFDVNGSIGGKIVNIYGSETTNKDKALVFCASDKSVRARIYYTGNTTDGLLNIESLYSNIAITTNSGKYVGIGTTTPSCKLHVAGDILSTGGITMYSDKRKKTILNKVELTLTQIADAPLVEHYYNSDAKKTTHVGSIAQYWAGLNDWFCKLDNEGFYTMEIQNAALASAISIARELQRYESKTDKKIRLLKERIGELEEEIEKLKRA